MAKSNNLNAAMQELKRNYRRVLGEAVQYASEEARKDVYTRALTCLEEYYANYPPSSYDRSDSLKHAFVPYTNITNNNVYIISTVGVEYNAGILEAHAGSSYDASRKYGRADAAWVIDNYLEGIHPTTDGSSIAGEAVYTAVVDGESPTDKMEEYLTNYINIFDKNVYSYVAAYVMSL